MGTTVYIHQLICTEYIYSHDLQISHIYFHTIHSLPKFPNYDYHANDLYSASMRLLRNKSILKALFSPKHS